MRSSTPDATPAQVPAGQVTADAPAAGNARPPALKVRLADLVDFTAEFVAAILGGPVW